MNLIADQKPISKKETINDREFAVTPYVNGKKHGVTKHYLDSKLFMEVPYKNGKKHGVLIFYYKNGDIHSITSWKNGKKYGIDTSYHENGYVATIWRIGKDGQDIEARTYGDGDGIEIKGIPPNPLKSVSHRNEKRDFHGPVIRYWKNGKPKWVRIFDDGKVIYSESYKVKYPGCTSEGLKIDGVGTDWSKLKIGEQ